MGLFKTKKKPVKKEEVVMASAPEEPETEQETEHIAQLSSGETEEFAQEQMVEEVEEKTNAQEYREVPVCLSQTQINNLVIENNIMLKQIMTNLD